MSVDMVGCDGQEKAEEEVLAVPLTADVIAALNVAVFQRRSHGDESVALADVVQEAVEQWLDREIHRKSKFSIRV